MGSDNNTEDTVGTGIRLAVEVMAVLDKLAERENRSRNNLIQMLLEEALKKRGEL